MVPSKELSWFNFSWGDLNDDENQEIKLTSMRLGTLQIPIQQGPAEYWGCQDLF